MSNLFIIGAGASIPYGFPSGEKLITQIERLLEPAKSIDELFRKGRGEIIKTIIRYEDKNLVSGKLLKEVLNDLKTFPVETIDDYIRNRVDYKDYIATIQRIIAACILYYERNMVDTNNWIQLLCNRLDRWGKGFEYNFFKSKFIIFNYDRIFEHTIFKYLTKVKGHAEYSAMDIINNSMNIIHIHGSLGTLNDLKFGAEQVDNSVTQKLRTIWDRVGNARDRWGFNDDRVNGYIHESNRIFFLGFGYLNANLEILDIWDGSEILNRKEIYGTAVGLSNYRVSEIRELMKFCGANKVEIYECFANDLIKDYFNLSKLDFPPLGILRRSSKTI
ncbi:MAG: hypothetical protein FWC26_05475 [Fibromonadales bacterium]|nr:hypothetical protein [Fibromonadales bacterium]